MRTIITLFAITLLLSGCETTSTTAQTGTTSTTTQTTTQSMQPVAPPPRMSGSGM